MKTVLLVMYWVNTAILQRLRINRRQASKLCSRYRKCVPITTRRFSCDVLPLPFEILSVQRKHCAMEVKKGEAGAKGTVTLVGGRGDVWHNGKPVRKQEQVKSAFESIRRKSLKVGEGNTSQRGAVMRFRWDFRSPRIEPII